MAGLKPNDFNWIIEGKLAVSECIGGSGLTPRKIRREEEIQWLKGQGINSIFSLLDSDFNLKNYQEVGFRTYHYPLNDDIPKESLNVIFDAIKEALADKDRKLLIHRELLDEQVPGILAGYLIYSKLLDDPILARTILEKILEKPLSPKAIALIPTVWIMSFDIHLSKIKCFGKHGIYDNEKNNEQKFFVDIYINIDDFEEDSISNTINYEEVADLVIEIVASESFDLIESLSKNIVKKIVSQYQKGNFTINEIKVTVHKPDTILKSKTQDISVSYFEKYR